MKKVLAVLLSLLLLCGMVPLEAISVAADTDSGTTGDCTWTLDDDGHLTISGNGAMGDYYWDDSAPWGTDIISVTIEDGVTAIGEYAFYYCESLTSVTIGDSVTTIGLDAFAHCDALTSVTIPDNVTTIAASAFFNCLELSLVNIGDGVTTIGCYAFSANWELATICLPLSLTEVDDRAFEECPELTDVYYPGSEEDRAKITFGEENDALFDATWHYNFSGCLHSYSGSVDTICDLCGEERVLPTIEVGVETMANIARKGATADFVFVPQESGFYTFGSYGDEDTYGYILDADGNEIASDDDGGDGSQFLVKAYLTAGETYIFRARFYNDGTGSFPVRVGHRVTLPIEVGVEIMANIEEYDMPAEFVFIPQESGFYTFGSYGDEDTYGCILDADGNIVAQDDDGGDDRQFLVKAYLTAGETYTLQASFYNENIGSFPVRLDYSVESIIEVGVETMATVVEHDVPAEFVFIPQESGLYTFGSYGDDDTYGWIRNVDGDLIASDDDGGDNNQFLIKVYLTAGEIYLLQAILYGGDTGSFPVRLDYSLVVDVTIDDMTIVEYTGGCEEDFGYYYYLDNCRVTLTYEDGTCETDYGYRYDLDIDLWDMQSENPWTVGNTYPITVTALGFSVPFTVTIVENPVVSIEVEDVVHIEGTGEFREFWDDETEEYVQWMRYSVFFNYLTVTLNDGTVLSGSRSEVEEELGISIDYTSDQSHENQWGLGDHTAIIYIGAFEAEYTVRIIENPVVSVEVEDVIHIEGTGEFWESWDEDAEEYVQWMRYSVSFDYLTVTLNDGTVLSGDRWEIENELGMSVDYTSDQSYENQWGVGDHTATIYIGTFEAEYTVRIVENPIVSLELEDVSIIENTHGYEEDGFFLYSDVYAQGVVTFADGTTQEFSFKIEIYDEWYYSSINAEELQYEEAWTAGNTYTVTATIAGVSATFNVTIVPTPVESFVVKDMVLYEGWNSDEGEYYVIPRLEQVLLKDGTLGTIDEYGYLYYNGESYDVDCNGWDLQYEEPWLPGNAYTVTATLMGATTTFNVTILPNPVKEVIFTKLPDKTTYLVGEALDLKGAVLRVVYTDGTYEEFAFDTHFAGGYDCRLYLEKYDYNLWFYQNIWFAEAGSYDAEVDCDDYTCIVPVQVQENLMESLTVREDANKNIILTAHNSDGTTVDMKLLDIPYIWPVNEERTEYYGSVLTDQGCYLACIHVEEDTFAISLFITQEDPETGLGIDLMIESEPIVGGDWFRVMQKMLTSNWYCFFEGYSIAYNREVTAENIDAVVALAMYLTSVDWWDDMEYTADEYLVFDADYARAALLDVFGLSNVDLSLSQYYDAATNTMMMFDWIRSGGEVSFDGLSNTYYADGLWHVTVHAFSETVNVWFDDDMKIAAVGIRDDIPTAEPPVPTAKPGDANGDGRINNKDLGMLQQYLNDWVVTIDTDAVDVNGDGRINNKDLGLIQQYLNDWDVELK